MPPADPRLTRAWIRFGLAAGVLAMAAYMLLLLLTGPDLLLVGLAVAVAPLLAAGAAGVHRFVALHRRSVALDLGTAAVAVAGVVFTLMGLVQLAVRAAMAPMLAAGAGAGPTQRGLEAVRYGLDLGWDLGFALGAVLVAWSLRPHPRYGWLFTVPGLLLGLAATGLAFAAFPRDPVAAGLFDLGPLLALWWLAVTARGVLSQAWVDERLPPPADGPEL